MDDGLHPAQVEAFRRMTPSQKLGVALRLIHEARALKAAALRAQHPEWSEERVQQEVRDAFLRAAG